MAGFMRVLLFASVTLAAACQDRTLPTDPDDQGPPSDPQPGAAATAHNGSGERSSFLTIAAPTVGQGDVLLAQIALTRDIDPNDLICAPVGWVLVARNHYANRYVQAIFYFIAQTAAEPAPHTWRFKTGEGSCAEGGTANARIGKGASGGIRRFTGVDLEEPIEVAIGLSGSSTPYAAPSVSTSMDSAQVIRFFLGAKHPLEVGSVESSEYNVGSNSNAQERTIAAFSTLQTAAGPAGIFTVTPSAGSEWVAATVALRPAPRPITPLSGQLAVGTHHGCVIQADGTTACWGSDGVTGGALGRGVRLPPVSARVQVAVDPGFASIHSRGQFTCARSTAGEAYCWGINTNGQALGDGTRYPFSPNPLVPTRWSHGPYARVSPARLTTCALTAGGAAVCWGLNQLGEVGDGTTTLRLTPVPVSTSLLFASIEASWIHTCALTAEGAAHCWGNWRGQVDGTFDLTPVELPGGHTFASLHSGSTHTCGITMTSGTWCWGDNVSGQLGDGTTSSGGIPVRVATQHFVAVATGTAANFGKRNHTCAVTNTGVVYCWGLNHLGQLGDGTTVDRLVPTRVLSKERFVAVGAGDFFSCAMTFEGRVFCWGDNSAGQLGSGVAGGMSTIPVLVP
jgi:alpha-tubulin suppressor-like RCC1 family protein